MYKELRVSFRLSPRWNINCREKSNAQVSIPCSGPVMHLLQKFLPGKTFAPIVTRDFRPPKPDPAGILHIAKEWELEDGGNGLIMVLRLFFY